MSSRSTPTRDPRDGSLKNGYHFQSIPVIDMTENRLGFFSWQGEMGRLDYWGSYILRSLISGLILCVLFFVIYGGYISAPSEDLMSTMHTWITENSVRGWIFSDVMNLLLIWPIMWRRWRDLGSKLKKGWLYIALISLVMPGFEVFQVVGLQALVYTLAILSIYPYIKLAFFPGKKHAMLQSTNP